MKEQASTILHNTEIKKWPKIKTKKLAQQEKTEIKPKDILFSEAANWI